MFGNFSTPRRLTTNRNIETPPPICDPTSSSDSAMYPWKQLPNNNRYYKRDGHGWKFPCPEPSRYYHSQYHTAREEHEWHEGYCHGYPRHGYPMHPMPIKKEHPAETEVDNVIKMETPEQKHQVKVERGLSLIHECQEHEGGERAYRSTVVEHNCKAAPGCSVSLTV